MFIVLFCSSTEPLSGFVQVAGKLIENQSAQMQQMPLLGGRRVSLPYTLMTKETKALELIMKKLANDFIQFQRIEGLEVKLGKVTFHGWFFTA